MPPITNGHTPTHTRPPVVRKRHAARVRDWRERDVLRKRIWDAMSGPRGHEVRSAIERALRRATAEA
jgi:hypothetical protein